MPTENKLSTALQRLALSKSDTEAWEILYRYTWPFVYSHMRRMLTGSSPYLEDGCQDVFLRVLRYCDFQAIREAHVFLAYVRAICKNVVRDYVRGASRHLQTNLEQDPAASEKIENLIGTKPNPEEEVQFQELSIRVFGRLNKEDRELLKYLILGYDLSEIDEKSSLSYAALATRIGVSVDDVLKADLDSIAHPNYPGEDCLTPEEVQDYADEHQMPADRLNHLEQCPACTAILDAIDPPEELVRQYMEEVRQLWCALERGKKPLPSFASATQRPFPCRNFRSGIINAAKWRSLVAGQRLFSAIRILAALT